MSWIEVIDEAEAAAGADGALRAAYDRVRGPHGRVDNVMRAHSLRPRTMEAHHALYRAVLHAPDAALPAWLLETLGVHTSLLNRCAYSAAHHLEGLRRIVGDARADAIRSALASGAPESDPAFTLKEQRLLAYVGKLTNAPGTMEAEDVEALRAAGASDVEILEANQVAAYFGYANRVLNGLGVTTEGDQLGESPRT